VFVSTPRDLSAIPPHVFRLFWSPDPYQYVTDPEYWMKGTYMGEYIVGYLLYHISLLLPCILKSRCRETRSQVYLSQTILAHIVRMLNPLLLPLKTHRLVLKVSIYEMLGLLKQIFLIFFSSQRLFLMCLCELSRCLGLISDSFHMFFDCTGLLAGLVATVITKVPVLDVFSLYSPVLRIRIQIRDPYASGPLGSGVVIKQK
jgi:hypothetical protein